jgi:hypothetical protein
LGLQDFIAVSYLLVLQCSAASFFISLAFLGAHGP